MAKCRKELASFKKMEETLRSNPKFGNTNQLRKETEQVMFKIAELENALASLRYLNSYRFQALVTLMKWIERLGLS